MHFRSVQGVSGAFLFHEGSHGLELEATSGSMRLQGGFWGFPGYSNGFSKVARVFFGFSWMSQPGYLRGFQEHSGGSQGCSRSSLGVPSVFHWGLGAFVRFQGRFKVLQRLLGGFRSASGCFKGFRRY